jgi:hypothetical protein
MAFSDSCGRFILVVFAERFRVAGLTERINLLDRVAVVPNKYVAVRADRIPVHTFQVECLSAFSVRYELNLRFLTANTAGYTGADFNFCHYFPLDFRENLNTEIFVFFGTFIAKA